jgi:hypothetical protein
MQYQQYLAQKLCEFGSEQTRITQQQVFKVPVLSLRQGKSGGRICRSMEVANSPERWILKMRASDESRVIHTRYDWLTRPGTASGCPLTSAVRFPRGAGRCAGGQSFSFRAMYSSTFPLVVRSNSPLDRTRFHTQPCFSARCVHRCRAWGPLPSGIDV